MYKYLVLSLLILSGGILRAGNTPSREEVLLDKRLLDAWTSGSVSDFEQACIKCGRIFDFQTRLFVDSLPLNGGREKVRFIMGQTSLNSEFIRDFLQIASRKRCYKAIDAMVTWIGPQKDEVCFLYRNAVLGGHLRVVQQLFSKQEWADTLIFWDWGYHIQDLFECAQQDNRLLSAEFLRPYYEDYNGVIERRLAAWGRDTKAGLNALHIVSRRGWLRTLKMLLSDSSFAQNLVGKDIDEGGKTAIDVATVECREYLRPISQTIWR